MYMVIIQGSRTRDLPKFKPDMSQLDTCLNQLSRVSKIPGQSGLLLASLIARSGDVGLLEENAGLGFNEDTFTLFESF